MKILKKGRTVLKLSFILDVLVTSELVQRHVKQTTKDQGIMIYSILEKQGWVSALISSTVPAGTNLDRFQSVYKERTAIPYVDHNVVVTTVLIATKKNFSRNDSFVNCWVCSVDPPWQVRSTFMVRLAVSRYTRSCARRKSVPVFCQISITFSVTATNIAASIGVIQNLVLIAFWGS